MSYTHVICNAKYYNTMYLPKNNVQKLCTGYHINETIAVLWRKNVLTRAWRINYVSLGLCLGFSSSVDNILSILYLNSASLTNASWTRSASACLSILSSPRFKLSTNFHKAVLVSIFQTFSLWSYLASVVQLNYLLGHAVELQAGSIRHPLVPVQVYLVKTSAALLIL